MRYRPTALGWIDYDISTAPEWDSAQVRRLARSLGYALVWPPDNTAVGVIDTTRTADVDAVITPAPTHLDAPTLDRMKHLADIETVCPRMSFTRNVATGAGA
ncbi:hypothetical protein AB0N05_14455 [Nocardia sp. NPDC051030]|uniref:hypothetical protein n=1 Tax=Nocardia sp. NPDC051030 TaxID=3155162 RepID=UPI00342A79B1